MQINIKKYKTASRLSSNLPTRTCIGLTPVVQILDSAINAINCYQVDK